VALNTSAALLPDTPANHERFQWLAKQLNDGRGNATLVRAREIEGMSHAQVVALFNGARAEDYNHVVKDLAELLRADRKKSAEEIEANLERLRARVAELQEIDFFECPRAHDARMLMQKAEQRQRKRPRAERLLKRAEYQGRVWLTRPHPQIDRVGSAWLIKTFIDPSARFVFSPKPADHPDAVPYDMADVELTHQGDDCTFETLLKRFAIRDRALEKIAEMVHDADLHDEKFRAPGADGIDRVLAGLARLGWADDKILQHGFACFDALYEQVRATTSK
jgi:hypothetical protein